MKKFIYGAAVLSMAIGSFAFATEQQQPSPRPSKKLMRMDCRFYGEKHSCVAGATYWVTNHFQIHDIKYGVSCDRQTIYNNGGTYMPQEQVSDGIRPNTSAVPRVELMPQFALRNDGTYTSKLETEDNQFLNGVCYVNTLYEQDNGSGSQSGSQSGNQSGSQGQGNDDHGHGNQQQDQDNGAQD